MTPDELLALQEYVWGCEDGARGNGPNLDTTHKAYQRGWERGSLWIQAEEKAEIARIEACPVCHGGGNAPPINDPVHGWFDPACPSCNGTKRRTETQP